MEERKGIGKREGGSERCFDRSAVAVVEDRGGGGDSDPFRLLITSKSRGEGPGSDSSTSGVDYMYEMWCH